MGRKSTLLSIVQSKGQPEAYIRVQGGGGHCQYIHMQYDGTNVPTVTIPKILLFFHTVLSFQHGDIISPPEFENLDQISTSMQSHRLNKGADLII